ncbi:unnamed protein product [Nezara viridula]|uniref:Uncharacterized protein n=1 Tax=Nezara viridula TaxID=85310 RepID=A0A9P0EEY4_NEZVI|nr:unnamed protein product [Nezara viridula]
MKKLSLRSRVSPLVVSGVGNTSISSSSAEVKVNRGPKDKSAYAALMDEYVRWDHVCIAKNPSLYVMTHHGVIHDKT